MAKHDGYAVNFRSMHTAIHGLLIGTKYEMRHAMAILDEMEKTKDAIAYEILADALGDFHAIEEIDYRNIKADYTYRDAWSGKTYTILNRHCYDIYC